MVVHQTVRDQRVELGLLVLELCERRLDALDLREQGGRATRRLHPIRHEADFTFTAEPAVFSVAKPRETIPGKKTTQVAVAYKPDGADAKPATGKLTIASVGADQSQWVYYLSGSS